MTPYKLASRPAESFARIGFYLPKLNLIKITLEGYSASDINEQHRIKKLPDGASILQKSRLGQTSKQHEALWRPTD